MERMAFSDGVIEVAIQLAPTFVIVGFLFVILTWIRLLLDGLSGRNF